jgi:hypothetical protein
MTSLKKTSKFSAWDLGKNKTKSSGAIQGVDKNQGSKPKKETEKKDKGKEKEEKMNGEAGKDGMKKETLLALSVKKTEDFSNWYTFGRPNLQAD